MPVSIDPRLAEAMQLHTAGRFDEAWARYRQMEQENPQEANVVHLMGVLAGQVGNLLESVARIQRAIEIQPGMPEFHKNLAVTFQRLGDGPKACETFINLGNVYTGQNRLDDAIAAFEQATKADPKNEHGFNNLGVTLNRVGRYAEARDLLNRTLQPDPRMPAELAHWSGTAMPQGFLRQLPSVHLNLGNAYHGLGQLDEAIASQRRALALRPDLPVAHNDLALALLLAGQYEEGWREFEWRWKDPKYNSGNLARPMWNGEAPPELGGPLFVLSEQGYGDAIQFARYLPLLAERGYDVVFEVKPELWSLFTEGLPHERIALVPAQLAGPGLYGDLSFSAYTGTFSLPRIFQTTLETVPAQIPYLTVLPERAARWARRLSSDKPTVGLVWGGNPLHMRNFERSMPPEYLHKLLERDDATFFSVQKGPAATYDFPRGNVVALDPELTDFAETAAALAALDVVIGVDTAVMHLAGALGKPAWILLAKVPDWRWGLAGDASPWYPTARLFRQQAHGDWNSAVLAAGHALDQFIAARPETQRQTA